MVILRYPPPRFAKCLYAKELQVIVINFYFLFHDFIFFYFVSNEEGNTTRENPFVNVPPTNSDEEKLFYARPTILYMWSTLSVSV